MGKKSAPRRLPETEAQAVLRNLRTSPRKLNLVAQLIRGKKASAALAELTFNKRRIAKDVKKTRNNKKTDRLIVRRRHAK